MTTDHRPTTSLNPNPNLRLGGVLYLVTFLSSIPAVLLLAPALEPGWVTTAGSDTRVLLGCVLDLVNAVACVGTAVVLFPVTRREQESLAIGFVTSRLFEAAVIVVGVLSLLAVVTLRREVGGPDTTQPALDTVARALVTIRDWTFLVGPALSASINAALLGTLMHRMRVVPRAIPLMGLVGAPLLATSFLVDLFRAGDRLAWLAGVAVVPIFLWELSLGLYLTFRGGRAGAGTARSDVTAAARVVPA
jgi:hypothetical protein